MATQASSSPTPAHPVFSNLLNLLSKIPHPICSNANLDGGTMDGVTPGSCFNCDGCKGTYLLHKVTGDVSHIQRSLYSLSRFEENLGKRTEAVASLVNERDDGWSDEASGFLAEPCFKELVSAVTQLKFQLPYTSYYELSEEDDENPVLSQDPPADAGDSTWISDTQLRSNYDALQPEQKKCLWCFSVFPENAEIKKRVLINWWIGEGLLLDSTTDSPVRVMSMLGEEKGEDMLMQLEANGFIQQVEKKRRKSDRWWMGASVRSFLKSKETEDRDNLQLNEKFILLHNCSLDTNRVNKVIKTVFNVDKPIIVDSEAEILAGMKKLAVLHLGRSQVKGLELIMKGLKRKKQLSLLSLAGILSIRELPGSVCDLTRLKVLDLKSCQALQRLPSGIGNLKSLTHLDVSGCHILLQMPEQISSLSSLEVLKGFVIGPIASKGRVNCSLHGLRKLVNLHKLSLSVLRNSFPTPQDVDDLANIKGLVKLKIVWKPAAPERGNGSSSASDSTAAKPPTCCMIRNQALHKENVSAGAQALNKLEKLDLWFTPDDKAQILLAPSKFPTLKKLYIRGASFDHLDYRQNNNGANWDEVEMLRLLSLPNLKMNWHDLKNNLFLKLSYLEMQRCPNLQFSPHCDNEGVWKEPN